MRRTSLVLFVGLALLACGGGGEPGEILRTPDERFANLPDFPYEPRYEEIDGLRIHYVDEGPSDARPVLLLHGEPSWAFLYRKMIPGITAAGLRAVVPDLVGFGRSDKYAHTDDYSYAMQVRVMAELVRRLDLQDAIFFGQDWGGLIGLRVVAEDEARFAAVVVSNTGLPDASEYRGGNPLPFLLWRTFSRWTPHFPTSGILDQASVQDLPDDVLAAYEAPFPTRAHMAGARIMPSLVPITESDPAIPANRAAWDVFSRWEKPFLTAFSDSDPITAGGEAVFQERIPGTNGQPHVTIENAGHFVQEDAGEELAEILVALANRLTPAPAAPAAR